MRIRTGSTTTTADPGWIYWIWAGSTTESTGRRLLLPLLKLGGVTACRLYRDTERCNPVSEGHVGGKEGRVYDFVRDGHVTRVMNG